MSLMIIEDGDVYTAEKNRIIGEIIGMNIWRNEFLFHTNNIRPPTGNTAKPYVHVDEKYRNYNAPKTYDFLFNFMKLDYTEVDKLWRNDSVSHMHYGLQYNRTIDSKDITFDSIAPNIDNALTAMNQALLNVDKITIEIVTTGSNNNVLYNIPTSVVKGWDYGYMILIGDRTSFSLDDIHSRYTPPYTFNVRFFSAGVEVLGGASSAEKVAYGTLFRDTNALEDAGATVTVSSRKTEIWYKCVADYVDPYADCSELEERFRINTTYTFTGTAGNFSNVLSYKNDLTDYYEINYKKRNAYIFYPDTSYSVSQTDNSYTLEVDQVQYRVSDLAKINTAGSARGFLIDSGDLYTYGWYIDINMYNAMSAKEVLAIISALWNVWIEQGGSGFWGSIVGKVISFAVLAIAFIISAIITIASGGSLAYVGALIMMGTMILLSLVGANATFIKMAQFSSLMFSVISAGYNIATAYNSLGTTTTTTTYLNTATGQAINGGAVVTQSVPGIVSSTSISTINIGGQEFTKTVVTNVASTLSVSASIVQNLSGAFGTMNNLLGGQRPPSSGEIPPEDTAETQDEVNHYIFTSGFDMQVEYYDFEDTYDMDKYFA